MNALIMAGGRGQRMGSLTDFTPKPMLLLNGKPIIQHTLEKMREEMITDIWISVHYLKEVIMNYFGDGSGFGVRIRYLEETSPMGTIGCVSLLPDMGRSFIVQNGDVLTGDGFRYLDFCDSFVNLDTSCFGMGVHLLGIKSPYGSVKIGSGMQAVSFREKRTYKEHVNTGIYHFTKQVQDLVVGNLDADELIKSLIDDRITVGVCAVDGWRDVGTPEDYARACKELSSER